MGVKLNLLLQKWPHGGVATATWLESMGIYKQLRNRYLKGHWLRSLGYGAFTREGDKISWEGCLSALQNQLQHDVHLGGKSALEVQGLAHFIPLKETRIFLFSKNTKLLPKWFSNNNLNIEINFHHSLFLDTDLGIEKKTINGFPLNVSSPERAFFEVLYLAPNRQSLQECQYLAENLRNLRPKMVQSLLESCSSIKVKRLFLLFADYEQFQCFKYLSLNKVDLGRGSRNLIKSGYLEPKYKITIPKNLFQHEE